MTFKNKEEIILPFLQSKQSRYAYFDRTEAILAAVHNDSKKDPIVLTLPNIDIDESKVPPTRPTSTYILRSPTQTEWDVLLDPAQCNCRVLSPHGTNGNNGAKYNLKLMYRTAGNGEAPSMTSWDLSSALKDQIRNCNFGGEWLVLGVVLDGPDSVGGLNKAGGASNGTPTTQPTQLRDIPGVTATSLLSNSILEPFSSIHSNSEISSTHVMGYASITSCGTVSCPEDVVKKSREKYNFDMKEGWMDVEVGPEAGGGRVVRVRVESTLVDVCRELGMDSGTSVSGGAAGGGTIAPLIPSTTNATTTNNSSTTSSSNFPPMTILCPHSTLTSTPTTTHTFLSPHSTISSATSITSSLLLPHSSISTSSTVSHALLQWNSHLSSHSDAHHVFLMEASHVGPHSFTANAIYGPDSHVSGGEVHCTIFGPNANAHHQSLLIGILWPLGRGNVGYGSNVGSNHTGRIPDQETSVGEGTFWGLGSVIKFPIDLTSAPYSIVAAGVQLPPQRITLPFSLITDGPGGMNQLTPGWLLHYSPYTIARSEVKFANRRTAKRHDFYTGWKIVRGSVMDMCWRARDALVLAGRDLEGGGQGSGEKSDSKTKKRVFRGDRAIPGLGANQLTEKGRQIGIRAYTDVIQRYALRGLLDRLVTLAQSQNGTPLSLEEVLRHVGLEGITPSSVKAVEITASKPVVDWPILPWNEAGHADPEAAWNHQHSVLMNELPSLVATAKSNTNNILAPLLEKCIALEDDHAKRVYKSKSRDDARGAKTVPGYKDVHVAAEEDKVVLAAKEEAGKVREDVRLVEGALGGGGGGVKSKL